MLNINAMIQKAIQEQVDTSIMSDATEPAKAKIILEIPGQDTVVLDGLDEFMIFHEVGNRSGCVGIATIPFLIRMFKELKGKIDKAICNGLAEALGR
ncbi:hypothetical protein [Sporomusa aerivorans]|uniref:hypothetical protein n=1 Tax=Sporomusa aerivorans TaxID=204936 RepID=UPI00352BB3E8